MEGHRIKFLLCSVYDVLPTPSNLHTWGLAENPSCGRPANFEHNLSSCRSSLADGKFRWRRDQILTQLAACVEQTRKKPKQLSKGPRFIHFHMAGESAAAETRSKGVLATASDWEMQADLRKQLKFPEEITHTSLIPNIVLWSKVPWEERMEEAHECKLKKYQALIFESQQNGWKAWNLPVEVSCRGFAGQSLRKVLGLLGIEAPARKRLVANITKQAEAASQWI
ncbi:hypothetical protein N1851_009393 [Merluccius polli]|uniref:Uncharacterized protein n=1 Tax=Merluccius polli TaxID=89951 RepID=A0AA47MZZ6_MERPO|nr:hypothetical protein N1851_009393 [Merluccius polli]